MMRRALLLSSTAFLLSGLLAGAANTALPDTVQTFDDLSPGEVTTQLENRPGPGQGVIFGRPANFGFTKTKDTQAGGPAVGQGEVSRFVCGAPSVAASDRARSGGKIARVGCGTEFGAYGTFGLLPRWRTKLTVYVQAFTPGFGPGTFVLTAYDYRRNPIATQTTETAAGPTGWQPLTITTGSPRIAYFAVYLNRIEAGGIIVGIDDLTYDQPSVPPDPQISFSRVDGSSDVIVHQGETASVDFRVTRWNGSVGNVALTTDALNPEIDAASFSPNPAAGTLSKLFLHAAINPAFDGDFGPELPLSRATATPLSTNAGTTPDSHTFPLGVLPVFGFRPVADKNAVDLPACTPTTIPTGLSVAGGFQQPISLKADVTPALVDATLSTTTYTSGFSGVSEVKLYARPDWLTSFQDAVLTITASSPGYPTRRTQITLRRTATRIEDVVADVPGRTIPVTELETQQFVKPAQKIVIRGVGFCPGTTVEFGNKHAIAGPDTVSADGIRIAVRVPRLATSGRLTVIGPSGNRVSTGRLFFVKSYRNQHGFSFVNRAGRVITWNEFVEVFGNDATHFSVDACPWLPLVKCDVTTPLPSPLAVAFYLYAANVGTKGLCFGMSVASLRLTRGAVPLSDFRPLAKTVWELPGPSGPSATLNDYIHKMHLLQHSIQLTIYRKKLPYDTSAAFHDDLVDQLRRNEAAVIGFRSGESGHAVVAYDIRERGGGNFDVLAYNPNDPFVGGDGDAAADAHKTAEDNSTLRVNANNTWSFAELGWSGTADTLYLIPYAAIPFQPRIPEDLSELWYFAATGSGRVSQVTNEAGQDLFVPGGRDNIRAFPGARVLAPLDSREGPNPTVILPTGRTYTASITGRARREYSAGFFSQGLTALVEGRATAGLVDRVTVNGKAGSLSFQTGGRAEPVAVTLVASASDGSIRTATLRTTSARGATDTLAFDRARGVVSVRHQGPSAAISVELGWTGKQALPTAFTSTQLRIGSGETLAFSPGSWRALGSRAVTLTQTRASGSRITRTLRSAARATVAIRALTLKRKVSGRRATVSLTGRVVGAGRNDALATVTFLLMRGKQVVARSTTSVAAAELARPVTWRTKRLRPGRYTVVAAVTVLSGRTGSVALSSTSRSKRISFTVG